MIAIDSPIGKYYALKPAEFGFLESMDLQQAVQPATWSGFALRLKLRSSTMPGAKCLVLAFAGVRDLHIGPLEGLVRFFLEIQPIHDRQMEKLKYKVIETEYNAFAFFCSDFEAWIEAAE